MPWRKTSDPYHILVSEIMLQQTQVDRVIPKFNAFVKRFSTTTALANASLADVLVLWSGLGYNRRAKYLWQLAKMVCKKYDGDIPNSYEELRALPGVGDYTANAILTFAFKRPSPAVDTNVRNVVKQEFPEISSSLSDVKKVVSALMPKKNPDEFLHALMDYSSLVLSRPKRQKKSSLPFKKTNRYVRGEIMKFLTRHDKGSLTQILSKKIGRDKKDIQRAIDGLINERLIEKSGNTISLPK